jgi:hypothetical protein
VRRGAFIATLLLAVLASAATADVATIPAFSTLGPAEGIPPGWREIRLPQWKPPEYALVADEGATVLRVHSDAAAGSVAYALSFDPRDYPKLAWRWKIDRVVERGDLETRQGDDYAARVYVFFDVPESELPFVVRAKIKLARLIYGAGIPTAALCYVWDNRHKRGTVRASAYTSSVRMVVLESGSGSAGRWMPESRDLDQDFRAAFGEFLHKPTPRVTGIAVGNDTDQTRESVTAWFGDLKVEAGR